MRHITSRKHSGFTLAVLALAAAGGCRASASPPSAPATSAGAQAERVIAAASASRPEVKAQAGDVAQTQARGAAESGASEPAPHYALARHLERAELRHGDTQLFDFGVPGDAKYTLGGWLTFAGEHRTQDGDSLLVTRGSHAKLALPADSAEQRRLLLRVRSYRDTALTAHWNGTKLGDYPLSGKGLQTLELQIPAEALRAGENLLELRVQRVGSLPGMPGAGIGLDYVALSGRGDGELPSPPPPVELRPTPHELRVPGGARLGFALQVPEHASLRGRVRATGPARLTLTAVRDGAAPATLLDLEVPGAGSALDLPLHALAGEIVRLDFAAGAGAVWLDAPEVVTPRTFARPAAARAPIKNVLVLLVDTLRADKLSPYNDKTRVKTPGLSRFLPSAAVMRNARTQENWTKPSVATLLSSLFPWQHGAYTDDARVPESVALLPERLRAKGFFTGAFIANGYVSDKFGFGRGWNTYRNYIREGRRSIAQSVASDVLQWLDGRPKDKPFFLYVHTIDPHVPYKPPKDFLSMYDALPYAGPVDFSGDSELLEKIKIGKRKLGNRDKERLVALYDAEITYHDVHFAAIMDGLEKRGLSQDTMVVVTADHGEEFWDHGSVGHGHSVYDELLHIPMIVRVPGVTEDNRSLETAVGLVDVAPTIYDALGEPVPDDMAGRSFLPELQGEHADAPRVNVSGFMTGWRTLGTGRYKLVHRTISRMWLYDTRLDPGETRDLAADHPIAVRYLRGLLGLSLEGRTATRAATRVHKQEKTVIDAATEAQLRALGYVGAGRH